MASWVVCMTWRDCAVYVYWFDCGSCSSWAVNTSNLGSVGSSLRQETLSCLAVLYPGIWMGTSDIFGARGNPGMDYNLAEIDGKLRTSLPPKSRKGKWQILASAQLTICIFFYVNCMRDCSHSMVTTCWYKFIKIPLHMYLYILSTWSLYYKCHEFYTSMKVIQLYRYKTILLYHVDIY